MANFAPLQYPKHPTPILLWCPLRSKGDHTPDISFVESATRAVVPFLKEDDLYVIESTSPIGTTERMAELIYSLRPELCGKLHIAYRPERVLPEMSSMNWCTTTG